jgi:hypothetical protein
MLISIKPGRNRHDVRQYECPGCRDIFTLVSQHAPSEPDKTNSDRPALQAAAK